MRRTLLTLVAPPAAVVRFGCVACTAAPIGVFWLASLACIGYGVAGGALGNWLSANGLIAFGLLLWLIATAWARLVIRGVENDLHEQQGSTRRQQVTPNIDDPDPLSHLHGNH